MQNQKTQSKGWPTVAIIGKSKTGKTYLKFDESVTLLVNGKPLELGEGRFANLVSPTDDIERLIKNGIIKGEEAETKRESAKNSSVKYKVVIPPSKK